MAAGVNLIEMRETGAVLLFIVAVVFLTFAVGAAYIEWSVLLAAVAVGFGALGVWLLRERSR